MPASIIVRLVDWSLFVVVICWLLCKVWYLKAAKISYKINPDNPWSLTGGLDERKTDLVLLSILENC